MALCLALRIVLVAKSSLPCFLIFHPPGPLPLGQARQHHATPLIQLCSKTLDSLKIIMYYMILTLEKKTYIFYTTEIYYLTVISCQKIASSPTNINDVYKYEFICLFQDHFSKPTYFIKTHDMCVL